jgi:hypothetical protein
VAVDPSSGRDPVEPGTRGNRRGWGLRLLGVGLVGGTTFGSVGWGIVFREARAGTLPQPLLDAGFAASVLLATGIGFVCMTLALLMIFAVTGADTRLFARLTYLMELLPRIAAFGSVVKSGYATPAEVLPISDPLPLAPPNSPAKSAGDSLGQAGANTGQSATCLASSPVEDGAGHGDELSRQRTSGETKGLGDRMPIDILDPASAGEEHQASCPLQDPACS